MSYLLIVRPKKIRSLRFALAPAVPEHFLSNENQIRLTLQRSQERQKLAFDLNDNVSQIPVTLQVPVGIAANVCGVAANVLAQDKSGPDGATCEATTTSEAFNNLVQKNLVTQ